MVDFPNMHDMNDVHTQTLTPTGHMDPVPQPRGQVQRYGAKRSAWQKIGAFTQGSVVLILLLVLAQFALKDDLKPSKVWGGLLGAMHAEQIQASQPATVNLETQLAHVRADEQAKAQAKLNQLQAQLDTTKAAYGSLYQRGTELVTGFLQMQNTAQQYRAQAASTGNLGSVYVNMGTSFMCGLSRLNNDGDKDGWCASNDRVRDGQDHDLNSVMVTREQLQEKIFGGLPDPATGRVLDNPQPAISNPLGQ